MLSFPSRLPLEKNAIIFLFTGKTLSQWREKQPVKFFFKPPNPFLFAIFASNALQFWQKGKFLTDLSLGMTTSFFSLSGGPYVFIWQAFFIYAYTCKKTRVGLDGNFSRIILSAITFGGVFAPLFKGIHTASFRSLIFSWTSGRGC